MEISQWKFPCPRSRLIIWLRKTGSAVPSRVTLLIIHTQADSGAYSRDFSHFPRRRTFIYINCHPTSGQFRVHQVTQLRTDGVHCRESAGTVPVVPQGSSSNGCYLFRPHHGPINVHLSFPNTHDWYVVDMRDTENICIECM